MSAVVDENASADHETDAVWAEADDDRTVETLRLLRRKRRAYRRRRGGDIAVYVYSILLIAAGYGSGYTYSFLRRLRLGAHYGDLSAAIQGTLPAAFTLVTAAVVLLAARDALWRGPVVVPGPSVGWLLAQPVRRAAILRPWLWLTSALAVASGLLVCVVLAVVLHVVEIAPIGTGLLSLLPAAGCLPLLAVALATAVERRPRLAARVRRWTPAAVVLLALLAVQTGFAAGGNRIRALERFELWSGPWGWAAQPVLHTTGWPAAVLLLLAATALAVGCAHVDAARIPTTQLRRRAASAAGVMAVVWTVELRAAKLAVLDATGGTPSRRARLRPPRNRHLAVLWRDALSLLRSPGRLGKALTWTACASVAAGGAAQLGGELRLPLLVTALLLGYTAVGALAESARLETDDLRRSAWSPLRLRTLMLHHTVVPAAVGALLGVLAAVPYAVAGFSPWLLVIMPLCAFPFAAAAVQGACRGPARTELLFMGPSTPAGGPGPLLFVAWYACGPLATIAVLSYALYGAVVHGPDAATAVRVLSAAAVLTAGLLAFAARAATRMTRNG